MKNIKVYSLAFLGVVAMFYMGADGVAQNLSFGPFFIFVGACTTIGLAIDIVYHVKALIRKRNVRKLEP